jgi:hypothetical protein
MSPKIASVLTTQLLIDVELDGRAKVIATFTLYFSFWTEKTFQPCGKGVTVQSLEILNASRVGLTCSSWFHDAC